MGSRPRVDQDLMQGMAQRQRRRWNLIAITAVVVAALTALGAVTWLDKPQISNPDAVHLTAAPHNLANTPRRLTFGDIKRARGERAVDADRSIHQTPSDQAPYQVEVGVYTTSTSELELEVPSYTGSGYIWLHWNEAFQRYLERSNTTIEKRIVLLNSLISDATRGLSQIGNQPEQLDDGSYYQLFSFKGRYYIDQANFARYPFLTFSLPLALEVDDIDGDLDFDQLRLIPDLQNSGLGLYARITGWLNYGWSMAEYAHQYATNFGLGGDASQYSQIIYEISFGTSAWASFWRFLLPVAVVMTMVLLVFKVRSDEQDARASIPVTVLLTLVFLQQTYRDKLPDLPYLTFLDEVYVVAYVVTLAAFVLVILIGRRYADMEEMEDGEAKQNRLNLLERLDVIWPLLVVVFGAVAIAISWVTLPAGGS